MSTFSNLAIVTLFNINKFKRGAMLAQSVAKQKKMLKLAHFYLVFGNIKAAQATLAKWKIERASYKVALRLQGV